MRILSLALASALLIGGPAIELGTVAAQAQALSALDDTAAQAAIMSAGRRATQVRGLRDVPSVGVIRLDTYKGPPGEITTYQQFRIMAGRNMGGIQKLRQALKANPAARAALSEHGINVNRVVGVDISSRGSLRIYLL